MLLFSLLSGLALAERLAVLDFESTVEGDLSDILANQSRAGALDRLDALQWSIITRENMMQILSDMGKDAECISGNCEVEIARNIGADAVVSGQISELDGTYVVNLKFARFGHWSIVGDRNHPCYGTGCFVGTDL